MELSTLQRRFYEQLLFLVFTFSWDHIPFFLCWCAETISALAGLVFIVIHRCDSPWLPGASGRFMWLKLYMALSEHACNPPQRSSEWFTSWITMTNGLRATTTYKTPSLALCCFTIIWAGRVTKWGEWSLDITCWVILWCPMYVNLCCWDGGGGYRRGATMITWLECSTGFS